MSDEHDWVREHLSALRRPTMPEDVARRLDTAIAAVPQQADPTAAASDIAAPTAPITPEAVPTIPAQASGTNRRSGSSARRGLLALGGAAAALTLFVMVGPFSTPMGSDDSADIAAAPQESRAGDGAPEGGAGEPNAEAQTGDRPGSPGGAPTADLDRVSRVMTASETPYTRAQMADQAGQVAQTEPEEADAEADVAADAWARARAWPAATLEGASACVAALPLSGEDLAFVDRAEFEGQPALVVARSIGGGALEVFVQDVTCTADDPAIRFRTTVVP